MIPDIVKPYKDHPMVNNKKESDLERLDEKDLNDIIRAEDQLIRSVREYYLDKENRGRLTPGQFSSSILNARGMAFLDVAHYKCSVADICSDVWDITPTTAKVASFNQNMKTSVIRKLADCGIVEFDSQRQNVVNYMPYPVGSKLFVLKNLIDNQTLYTKQANHYGIVGMVQDFPELTSNLETNAKQHGSFKIDYQALIEIDAIRSQNIRGQNFTFSRGFLTEEKSSAAWAQVLEESDNIRIALKSLMDLQGDYGGFISHPEIIKATGWNSRAVSRLMRHVNYLGISRITHTLEMKDALTRSISGTLLNLNYHDLENAQSILALTREVPETVDILNKFIGGKELSEDELMEEFDNTAVQQVKNSLKMIRLIKKDKLNDGFWELVPFRGNDKFINDVLAVVAHSRRALPPDYDITNHLEDQFKKVDEEGLRKRTEQMKFDFFEKIKDEYIK